jgi:hypothetical protein
MEDMNYGNDEEMECSEESMLFRILESYTQTNKEGQLLHVFKILILNTNIQGLVDAFLVHYYILQIKKLNKFNVRISFLVYSFISANDQTIKESVMPKFLNPSLSYTSTNKTSKSNVRISTIESKSILKIHKKHKLIHTNIDSYKFLELFFGSSPANYNPLKIY